MHRLVDEIKSVEDDMNERDFVNFLKESGYDVKKVEILTALIFLNIARFHHYPYCHLLFYLGKNLLNNNLEILDGVS